MVKEHVFLTLLIHIEICARLTFMGICTPNIGTGGYNCHGIHEYADITEMAKIVSLVKRILTTK